MRCARMPISHPDGAAAPAVIVPPHASPVSHPTDLLATTSGESPALPLDLETYIDAARALDTEPFHVANLGRLREVVFGAQDGIISTVALTTSVAIAVGNTGTVLVAGTGRRGRRHDQHGRRRLPRALVPKKTCARP